MNPRLRAWWFHRQGLDGSMVGVGAADVLARSGWARSVGGVGPYLTMYSRIKARREATDSAAERLLIHELPAARGCTYVLPARDFGLGLVLAREYAEVPIRQAEKLGVTAKEVDKLCEAILDKLVGRPMDPDAIRVAIGSASRSLGEPGRKKGISTTLPLGLGRLQAAGAIRRVPMKGRLDHQRYSYVLWSPSPLNGSAPTREDALLELGRRYFLWVGPATMAEFQFFSGLGVKAARDVLAPLGLVRSTPGSDRYLLPEDAEAFQRFRVPDVPQYAMVSSLDAISAARRDVVGLLDPADMERMVVADGQPVSLGSLADLPSHAILDRGRLIGLWEFEPEEGRLIAATFAPPDRALSALIKETEVYVREELGDARSFSLDSPRARAPRIAALRKGWG